MASVAYATKEASPRSSVFPRARVPAPRQRHGEQRAAVTPQVPSRFGNISLLPPTIQRRCACGGVVGASGECEQCRQRRLAQEERATTPAAGRGPTSPDAAADGLTQLAHLLRGRSTGEPLEAPARERVETRTGGSLGDVNVHEDAPARAAARFLGARALTIGHDIYLGDVGTDRARVLDHEAVHTLQQRPWRGEQLSLAGADGAFEQDAERVAAGGSATTLQPAAPTAMPLSPATVVILAEFACAFGFFQHGLRNYLKPKGDAWTHCWTSCKIASWCPPVLPLLSGQAFALGIGALKELADVVIGEAEFRDMMNNVEGIFCSLRYIVPCDECCEKKLRGGELSQAESGPSEQESSVTEDEAVALAEEEVPEATA